MSDQTKTDVIRRLDAEELMIITPRLAAAIARWDRAVIDVGKEIDALVDLFPDVDADLWWDAIVETSQPRRYSGVELAGFIAGLVKDHRKEVKP